MRWYLVKSNWHATALAMPAYAGLGGDAWPLDGVDQEPAREMHGRLMAARQAVVLPGWTEMLCVDLDLAHRYLDLTWELVTPGTSVFLLEVGLATDRSANWHGFDVGSPAGGYSLIESEIAHGIMTADLNSHCLFSSVASMESYMNRREGPGLEDVESLERLGLLVLEVRRGS